MSWDEGTLILDVTSGERAYMPEERRPLMLPYSDLAGKARPIDVVALDEILGNKWYMLEDRREPRDLYDLWAGLYRFEVDFSSVVAGFEAKYGRMSGVWRLESATRLRDNWEPRLANQVVNLPAFEEVIAAVRAKVEQWQQDSSI